MTLSIPQQKALQTLAKRHETGGWCHMGGNKRAHVLSACRALVNKGFAINMGGGRFCITDAGLKAAHGINGDRQ